MSDLETRLRNDLKAAADDVTIHGDAWQQNQHRIRAASVRRRTRLLSVRSAAAAAAIAVIAVAISLPAGQTESPQPAKSPSVTPSPTSTSFVTRVKADERSLPSGRVASLYVSLSYSDDGPQAAPRMCDETSIATVDNRTGEASRGCGSPERGADSTAVAIDYLNASDWAGGRSLSGGVDERVSSLTVYYSGAGGARTLQLHDLADAVRGFGVLDPDDNDVKPQRLVARGDQGEVLQAIDLVDRFGDDWLPQHDACTDDLLPDGHVAVYPSRDKAKTADVAVWLGTTNARVSIRYSFDDVVEICIERLKPGAIAGAYGGAAVAVSASSAVQPGVVVPVLAPEVASVTVEDQGRTRRWATSAVEGSPWQVVIAPIDASDRAAEVTVTAFDEAGNELQRATVEELVTSGS